MTLIEFCNGTYPYPLEETEVGVLENILNKDTPRLSAEDFEQELVDLVGMW